MNESRIKILKEENIDKALFKLGIPMVISLLVAALYNVVDTYFVSGLGKEAVVCRFSCVPNSTYLFRNRINIWCGSRLLYIKATWRK